MINHCRWFKKAGYIVLIFIVIVGLWQLMVSLFSMPRYILPSPFLVFKTLFDQFSIILFHSKVTLIETLLGILLGTLMGLFFALILLMNQTANRLLLPILIISQSIPVFALAPILMLWFGYGMVSKVFMAAMIIFFPITLCCYEGLKNTPIGYLELGQTFHLTKWQMLIRIKLPAALPTFAAGMKVAVTIAPIGAVIGEWVGASSGLGYYMVQSNARLQVPEMFAALLMLSVLSISLYFICSFLLTKWINWGY